MNAYEYRLRLYPVRRQSVCRVLRCPCFRKNPSFSATGRRGDQARFFQCQTNSDVHLLGKPILYENLYLGGSLEKPTKHTLTPQCCVRSTELDFTSLPSKSRFGSECSSGSNCKSAASRARTWPSREPPMWRGG